MALKDLLSFDFNQQKKVRYGGYAALTSLIAVAALVLVNLVVDQLDVEIDLTESGIYTLSEQSKQVADGIEEPVTIYGIYSLGSENPEIYDILSLYAERSRNIVLKTLDPDRSPTQADRFDDEGGLRGGDLVVASDGKHRVISSFSYQLTQNTRSGGRRKVGLAVEQRVTSALMFVTSDEDPKIYSIIGHRENNATTLGLRPILEFENFDLENLNLLQVEEIPADASLVIVTSPSTDYTEEEVKKLRAYLYAGGKAIFALDKVTDVDFININELLRSYGVQFRQQWVIESDSTRHLPNQRSLMVPEIEGHAITAPISSDRRLLVLPASAWIEELEVRRRSLEIHRLLTSSKLSFARDELSFTEAAELLARDGDPLGPFAVAVAITEPPEDVDGDETRIVVIATSVFLNPQLTQSFPGNVDLMLNSINWVYQREEIISVRPKVTMMLPLRFSNLTTWILTGVVVVLVPLIVLGAGLIVWLRRRHL